MLAEAWHHANQSKCEINLARTRTSVHITSDRYDSSYWDILQ